MKYSLVFILAITASLVSAKTIENFNHVLTSEVQKDIQKDEDKFKKEITRKPASVNTIQATEIDEAPKLKNARQIGPNKW